MLDHFQFSNVIDCYLQNNSDLAQTLCLLLFISRLSDTAPSELHDINIIFHLLWKIVLFFTVRIGRVIIEEGFLLHCLDAPRKLPFCLFNGVLSLNSHLFQLMTYHNGANEHLAHAYRMQITLTISHDPCWDSIDITLAPQRIFLIFPFQSFWIFVCIWVWGFLNPEGFPDSQTDLTFRSSLSESNPAIFKEHRIIFIFLLCKMCFLTGSWKHLDGEMWIEYAMSTS